MSDATAKSEYDFTEDWFHWAPPLLRSVNDIIPDHLDFLEIGSFEGRSTAWIVENMLEDGGLITCIDTWGGGEEHSETQVAGSLERFRKNVEIMRERFPNREIEEVQSTSLEALAKIMPKAGDVDLYDFVYVDGSHVAKDVLTDAVMVWPMVKKGGVVVFDDYNWGERRDILHRPKIAVDAFMNIFTEEIDVLHMGYQAAVRKR